MRSVCSTRRKRGRSVLDALTQAFACRSVGLRLPSCMGTMCARTRGWAYGGDAIDHVESGKDHANHEAWRGTAGQETGLLSTLWIMLALNDLVADV